jgi:hypothetical protein
LIKLGDLLVIAELAGGILGVIALLTAIRLVSVLRYKIFVAHRTAGDHLFVLEHPLKGPHHQVIIAIDPYRIGFRQLGIVFGHEVESIVIVFNARQIRNSVVVIGKSMMNMFSTI